MKRSLLVGVLMTAIMTAASVMANDREQFSVGVLTVEKSSTFGQNVTVAGNLTVTSNFVTSAGMQSQSNMPATTALLKGTVTYKSLSSGQTQVSNNSYVVHNLYEPNNTYTSLTDYVYMKAYATDATQASEDGRLVIGTEVASTATDILTLDSSGATIALAASVAGAFSAPGQSTLGNVSVNTNLTVAGTIVGSNSLTVAGAFSAPGQSALGNVSVNTNMVVSGTTVCSNSLTLSGANGDLYVGDDATVVDALIIGGSVTATNTATFPALKFSSCTNTADFAATFQTANPKTTNDVIVSGGTTNRMIFGAYGMLISSTPVGP